ncbi:hypothetical protein [Alteromonas mediterranea]|uniref:hypothetical protein n=1 Tax=Alteromonas mediterranea TaxID=314275 RepID=UPI00241C7A52|nr:hypothetical protein [Alteromonas mediterranea]
MSKYLKWYDSYLDHTPTEDLAKNELESAHRKIKQLTESLAKANERVKKLEAINLELAANVEACCELVEMDMGAAIERLFEIDNTESKALLNKFAIEQKIEALDDLLEEIKCSVVVPKRYEQLQEPYLEGIKHCIQFIECQSEQLRKEQE